MSTIVRITIITPGVAAEEQSAYSSYLHRKLLWGSAVEQQLQQQLSAEEYRQLLPDECPTTADIDGFPRNPKLFKSVFTKVYDYLRLHSDHLPCQHWLNPHEDEIGHWSTSVTVRDATGARWDVEGAHRSLTQRDMIQVTARDTPHAAQWIPAQPDTVVGGKTIRVRTETWFEFCRGDIEELFSACTLATRLNLQVAWTIG